MIDMKVHSSGQLVADGLGPYPWQPGFRRYANIPEDATFVFVADKSDPLAIIVSWRLRHEKLADDRR
jgi:hypothetical protein